MNTSLPCATARRRYVAIFLTLLLLLTGCNQGGEQSPNSGAGAGKLVSTPKGSYRDITAEQLKGMMDAKDFFLVDVHVPNEGRLPRLDARIPYNKITEQLDNLPADKGAKIVLTCRSGAMSTVASRALADLGYTNVYNLVGGFAAWRDKGYDFTPEP